MVSLARQGAIPAMSSTPDAMFAHPRTPGAFWDLIGWKDQERRNAADQKVVSGYDGYVERCKRRDTKPAPRRMVPGDGAIVGRGERLGLIRARANMTPRKLARAIGVSPDVVTLWERNLFPIPELCVGAIEDACGAPLVPTERAA
jgi:hypothetical protein